MLTIGEFSKICQVSAKTLRYYAEIGLLLPEEVNPESGYRYYAIEQLKTMLFINRMKEYSFSLEEIKAILDEGTSNEEILCAMLSKKQQKLQNQIKGMHQTLERMNEDISKIKQGNSIMSYLDQITVQITEVPDKCLLSIRKMVHEQNCEQEYQICFSELLHRIAQDKLTMSAPPMVLFHSEEFKPSGLDMEFAIPVQEYVRGTRTFSPGLCLKTTLHGTYSNLSSVYAKQREWAEKEDYENTGALFEVYVEDPSAIADEKEQVTEIYYPVKKNTR